MRALFTFSMLTAAIFASHMVDLDEMGHKEFMAFIAANGRNYKNVEEMATRRQIFDKAKEVIMDLNTTIKGVSFKVNHFADMTQEEKEQMRKAGETLLESTYMHFEEGKKDQASTKDHRR